MNPAMYIFINKGAGMSTGKTAAQAGHAAVESFRLSMKRSENGAFMEETNLVRHWYKGGHYMKLVMECRDADHLRDTERYLNDRGFKTALIIDEGHTEVAPITPTALGVELVDKDDPHVSETFSTFRLYKDTPPRQDFLVLESTDKVHPIHIERLKEYIDKGELENARRYVKAHNDFYAAPHRIGGTWFSRSK